MTRLGLALVVTLTAFGCSGVAGADGPAALNDLSCGYQELRLRGTLGGERVDSRNMALNDFFLNGGASPNSGLLTVGLQNGTLELLMDRATPEGGTSPARGRADQVVSHYDVGNCETGPFVSQFNLSPDGKTARFKLRQLVAKPYCGGTPVEGELDGCYGLDL